MGASKMLLSTCVEQTEIKHHMLVRLILKMYAAHKMPCFLGPTASSLEKAPSKYCV